MPASFPFKEESSRVFGKVHRPIAEVFFKHTKRDIWQPVSMIVDTGADYTMLPRFLAQSLGIDLKRDCKTIETQGVGGNSKVFLVKEKISVKIGQFYRKVPLGFLSNNLIPPLLGRLEFFDTFKVTFDKFTTTFE